MLCGGCLRVRIDRRTADTVRSLGLLPMYTGAGTYVCEDCHTAAEKLVQLEHLSTASRRIAQSLCSRTAGHDGVFYEDGEPHIVERVILRRGCQGGFEFDARSKRFFEIIDDNRVKALADGLAEAMCIDVVRKMYTIGLTTEMRDYKYEYERSFRMLALTMLNGFVPHLCKIFTRIRTVYIIFVTFKARSRVRFGGSGQNAPPLGFCSRDDGQNG